MLYLDLDELPKLFKSRWMWSADRPSFAWFRRADHIGPADAPLADTVRDLVQQNLGVRPNGSICLLTHPRYAGFRMNPISLYYCYSETDELLAVVAEVTNTPWNEQRCYYLDVRGSPRRNVRSVVEKNLHVSPFLGMDYEYHFHLTRPGKSLVVHIENHPRGENVTQPVFDATLTLARQPISTWSLSSMLLRYPLITAQVYLGIYWQAYRLWQKHTPYFPHP